ncbi:NLR family CARD domain-containing protein 3, partial [Hondaea fermentalgiana]
MRRDATLGAISFILASRIYDERSLEYNGIGHKGATALANALANNESLHTLNLEYNGIGHKGVTALANALAYNESLQTL